MKRRRKPLWAAVYTAVLTAFTIYVLLDAFVIPRSYAAVPASTASSVQSTAAADTASGGQMDAAADTDADSGTQTAAATDSTYTADGISIQIKQYRQNDTTVYVADVTLDSADSLKTAFADNTYGKNITQTTSAIAQAQNAILAINGDFYGTRSGYVIRNGILYRETSAGDDQQDLVIYSDGTFDIIREGDVTAKELLEQGAWQVLSFGPALVEDGSVAVAANAEVDRAKTSNPRTAIGVIDDLHYVFVVADGRTSESTGLSLYQLAQFMQSLGVKTAYNLDGGGSSTMVFNGTVINNPTTNGNRISERKVSDIVYIG